MGFKFRITGSSCEFSGIAIHTANIRGRKKTTTTTTTTTLLLLLLLLLLLYI